MAESREPRPRWRRYAAEVLTIVVGILLALAADAGRQYVDDRAAEREILAALRVEFAVDVKEIGADQASRGRKLAAIELLSEVHAGATAGPDPDSLAGAVVRTMDWRYYTPSHAVLDDVMSTGRVELIRSDEVRRALMTFGQARNRLGVVEEQEREFAARYAAPYLAARLDLEALSSPRSPEQHAAAVQAVPDVVSSAGFGSLLYLARERVESSTSFAGQLLEAVSAVQKALGEQG